MNTTIKLPETIEDAKEELAQLFFQCASYERPSTDWIKALDSFTEQVATTALEAAEARHDQELLAYQIRVDRLEAELAQPEFPVSWATMIHYPECWDTAAYPELRDAIHEVLAWGGCSVCNPHPERKPMTYEQMEEIGNRTQPHEWSSAFGRAIEAFHGITEKP